MTNAEQLALAVINGLQHANQDWRVFKKDAKKTGGGRPKGGRKKKKDGPRARKYVLESIDPSERRVRLAGSEKRSEGMWMRTTFASLAENWTLQVHRGRTRFQPLSWKAALAEFGIHQQAEVSEASEAFDHEAAQTECFVGASSPMNGLKTVA